jgi:glycine/D-amino acid oxidase-like deaminating enzyme
MDYDYVIIGGGIYGCFVALRLAQRGRVVIVEQEPHLLRRASYQNQARVHGGYHYPRSLLTAVRSRMNAPRFVDQFRDAICFDLEHYYAISRRRSNVTSNQFEQFCRRVDADLAPASASVRRHFDEDFVETVFRVREYVFDAAKLGACLEARLADAGVEVLTQHKALRIGREPDGRFLAVQVRHPPSDSVLKLHCTGVFNCTYSSLNEVLARSGLETVRLKHEATEMALVEAPEQLRKLCITVVCGPFFSLMPFPPEGLMALSHVDYTPHYAWEDDPVPGGFAAHRPAFPLASRFDRMQHDAARYVPALRDCRYVRSLWEVKTVLPQSDINDSRPILFKRHSSEPSIVSVLGGKIDNVFDLERLL